MIKVDMISGFLGAGKTTLIKKLFSDCFGKEKVVLIENEFGEIGIDGAFLKESGVEIKEINSGCICCSLVGDFSKSMKEVVEKFAPDRIIIEPSGVGKLSDIIRAVEKVGLDLKINVVATVVDGGKCKMYHKNFGEFYNDQVKEANTVVVSKTDKLTDEKIRSAVELIREINPKATIVTTPIARLDGGKLLETLESDVSMVEELLAEIAKEPEHHHHHHHDHDGECCCGEHEEEHEHHHHDHDGECCCGEHEEEHEHHHHDHDGECCCGEHEEEHEHHHHDHDGECCCGEHEEEHEHHHHDHDECCCGEHGDEHEHHHDHDADEVFGSWGKETVLSFTHNELDGILKKLCEEESDLGVILRSKGIVRASDRDEWYYFDLVAGDYEIRTGSPDVIGRVVVIGSSLDKEKIRRLFDKE